MSNYITSGELYQAPIIDESTGEVITLHDTHYDWLSKHKSCMRLGKIYDHIHMTDEADKVRVCGTVLQYYRDGEGRRSLMGANFCKLRLCPMCIGRRARKMAWRVSRILDTVEAQHGCMYLFLTLTVRNCSGPELRDTLQALTKGWDKLLHRRQIKRSLQGWFRAMEITRNRRDGSYHPHIHAILAVPPDYFSLGADYYLEHGELMQYWREAMYLDYEPSVRIQVTRAQGQQMGSSGAALEAAKYSVKDRDYVDPHIPLEQAGEIVRTYTDALRRRRMVAMGGVIKQAAKDLDGVTDDSQEQDLVHIDAEHIREDVALMIDTYKWSFGVGDYILVSSEPLNPPENSTS